MWKNTLKYIFRRNYLFLLSVTYNFIMFSEHLATACARVDALRSHGYLKESLRLAVAIVRTLKRLQRKNQDKYKLDRFEAGNFTL